MFCVKLFLNYFIWCRNTLHRVLIHYKMCRNIIYSISLIWNYFLWETIFHVELLFYVHISSFGPWHSKKKDAFFNSTCPCGLWPPVDSCPIADTGHPVGSHPHADSCLPVGFGHHVDSRPHVDFLTKSHQISSKCHTNFRQLSHKNLPNLLQDLHKSPTKLITYMYSLWRHQIFTIKQLIFTK